MSWRGSCPVDALPPTLLGMTHNAYEVMREDGAGAWYNQYGVSDPRNIYYQYDPRKGVGVTMWYRPSQKNVVSWTGYYAP